MAAERRALNRHADTQVLHTQVEANKHLAQRDAIHSAKYVELEIKLEKTTKSDIKTRSFVLCEKVLRVDLNQLAGEVASASGGDASLGRRQG